MPQYIKTLSIAALTFIIGFFLGLSVTKVPPNTAQPITSDKQQAESQEKSKINIMVDFENRKVTTLNNIEINGEDSLLDIMKTSINNANIAFEYTEYEGLGALITKIGERKNGEDNSYWQYWVNGQMAQVGASSFQPQNGDIIEWKFLPDQGY